MRYLIAGCGYVGSELARQLLAGGNDEVFALKRSPSNIPAGAVPIACDLAAGRGLDALPAGLDIVVYAVGADASTPEAYRSAYVTGLGNLANALRARRSVPRRLIVVTSTAVYAQDDGSLVDETSETAPERFSGRILLESEHLAHSLDAETIAVRFGGIYGPGRTRFLDSVRAGSVALSHHPEYTNRIHRDDCAGLLAHLARLPTAEAVYLGVDDEPADRREVVEWIAPRLGVAPPSATEAPGSTPEPPRGKRCSNRRIRTSGYRFRFPSYREGYGSLLHASELATPSRRP